MKKAIFAHRKVDLTKERVSQSISDINIIHNACHPEERGMSTRN